MANPLYNSVQTQNNPMANLISQVREFRKTFNGNPRETVQQLLNSGQMSQQQFNQLSQIAQQVVQAMGEDI